MDLGGTPVNLALYKKKTTSCSPLEYDKIININEVSVKIDI